MSANRIRNAGLSDEQLAVLRARLENKRMELRARLARESAVPRESENLVEPLDAAEQTREQDDAISFANRDREMLGEVQRALDKIAAGTYGVSEISGEPIPFERLLALPWTRQDSDEDEDVLPGAPS
jgi:DnaK suppressor protein